MCEMERSFHQTVSMTDWAKLRQEKAIWTSKPDEKLECVHPAVGYSLNCCIGSTEAIRTHDVDIEVKDLWTDPSFARETLAHQYS